MKPHRIVCVACLSLLCGPILSGCASDAPGSSQAKKPNLREARKFDAYPIYYAGDEVVGLPFEGEAKGSWQSLPLSQAWRRWTFGYGDCDPPSNGVLDFEGGSCSLPLSIQNWSTCGRWASQLHGPLRLWDFRGAKATRGGGGSQLEIFTGRTTVVIWAHDRRVAESASRQLRDVRSVNRSSRLPPPVPSSLRGKLPCQGKPG
jgi:hypothetical protein